MENIPFLGLGGSLSVILKSEKYKCSMCGQVFEIKNNCPIFHSMTCTGV